jgi:hypothetical protein
MKHALWTAREEEKSMVGRPTCSTDVSLERDPEDSENSNGMCSVDILFATPKHIKVLFATPKHL